MQHSVGSHKDRAEGENHLLLDMLLVMQLRAQLFFLGCEFALFSHVQGLTHNDSQVLIRIGLNNLSVREQPICASPSVFTSGIALTQVYHLALGPLESHEVLMGTLLKIVQVLLDGVSFFRCINNSTQFCLICKLAEGELDLTVCVIETDIEEHWSQHRALRNNISHQLHPDLTSIPSMCLSSKSLPTKQSTLQIYVQFQDNWSSFWR